MIAKKNKLNFNKVARKLWIDFFQSYKNFVQSILGYFRKKQNCF